MLLTFSMPAEIFALGTSITFASAAVVDPSRIRLSAGTRAATAFDDGGSPLYCSDAIVPVGPWRAPTKVNLSSMDTHSADVRVDVRPIPPEVTEVIRSIGGFEIEEPSQAARIMRERKRELDAALIEALRPYLLTSIGAQLLSISVRSPGLCTTTIDPRSNCRIGLHVDSWDRLPIDRRRQARLRFCANLGTQHRWLLFVPQPVDVIGRASPSAQPAFVAREFLRLHSSNPTIAVRIDPGEAYLAPTERIIHDSSTHGTTAPDVSLTILGHFVL